ncbi:hypothetical protein CLV33_101446 [Jejuia pallidilutea]|uniref:WD40 repeat protein n=1 Tax=Jejuia pallidilutea TaxID=504487 RepID=A0A362XGT7_9FLAO|nr:hypothetical protein [Jejuia pallidilutea]PQV51522.1 hypothetical protein CLV33_101446 [Jejuia pallidilutea]
MNRRDFIGRTSAGILGVVAMQGCWSFSNIHFSEESNPYEFKIYRPGKTLGNVYKVTPDDGFYSNTYYTVNPWSPSGRYLALTKFPYQDKVTVLGDVAEVCIIDLKKQTIKTVYKTKVWGYQMGAYVTWGETDKYLYTNDVLNEEHAVGIQIDLETGKTIGFDGPMYDINASKETVIGPYLEYMNITQYSYGTPAKDGKKENILWPPQQVSNTDGIWKSSMNGTKEIVLSTSKASAVLSDRDYFKGGYFYFFSSRYNADCTKIMSVLRCTFPEESRINLGKEKRNASLVTCDADGNNVKEAVSKDVWGNGHHPSWHPDGEHIIMNLAPNPEKPKDLRFCKFKPDGSEMKTLAPSIKGSGHPTMRNDNRFLISDAYPFEKMALENGEVPIRLIDTVQDKEYTVCTIFTDLGQAYKMSRYWGASKLDAHPVWSGDYNKVCFNGAPDGNRQVFIADLTNFFSKF